MPRQSDEYEALIRWIHVPVWVLTLSFVAFVRLYLRAGRPMARRGASVACGHWCWFSISFCRRTINFLAITQPPPLLMVGRRPFGYLWAWRVPGVCSVWASLLLLLVFFVDATITVWRRGDRRRALFLGGSMIFGTILAWHVPLVIWGIIKVPFFLCFAYSGIVAAMGYELSHDMARAAHLARQLQASEADLRETQKRMELAARCRRARHVDVGHRS